MDLDGDFLHSRAFYDPEGRLGQGLDVAPVGAVPENYLFDQVVIVVLFAQGADGRFPDDFPAFLGVLEAELELDFVLSGRKVAREGLFADRALGAVEFDYFRDARGAK